MVATGLEQVDEPLLARPGNLVTPARMEQEAFVNGWKQGRQDSRVATRVGLLETGGALCRSLSLLSRVSLALAGTGRAWHPLLFFLCALSLTCCPLSLVYVLCPCHVLYMRPRSAITLLEPVALPCPVLLSSPTRSPCEPHRAVLS